MEEKISIKVEAQAQDCAWGNIMALFIMLLLCSLGDTVWAEIYTWSDSKNNITFSDRPPMEEVKAPLEKKELREVNYMDWKSTPKVSFDTNYTAKKPARSGKQLAKAVSAKRDACQRYRKELKNIQSQLRTGYTEPKGNKLRAKRRSLGYRLYSECR